MGGEQSSYGGRSLSEVSSPLKFFGGKSYIADWIISHFPPHLTYCEPFAGGLSVLLAKDPEGVSEVVNDLNGELTCFWRVLQDADTWTDFCRIVQAVPFSEVEFETAMATTAFGSEVDRAVNFFIKCRQSLAGRMKAFASISTSRTRRKMNEQVSAWLTAVEGLPAVHARLKRVLILNRDAIDVIRQFDKPNCVQYCDPPYMHETRTATDVYAHEMTVEQHEKFLDTVLAVQHAFVAVSGYRSELYDTKLKGWKRVEKEVPNHSAGGKEKRKMTEVLWLRE